MKILRECTNCEGTGLIKFFDFADEAEICVICKGTGAEEYFYTKYTGRKELRGINYVLPITSTRIYNLGINKEITYKEFQEKIIPPEA